MNTSFARAHALLFRELTQTETHRQKDRQTRRIGVGKYPLSAFWISRTVSSESGAAAAVSSGCINPVNVCAVDHEHPSLLQPHAESKGQWPGLSAEQAGSSGCRVLKLVLTFFLRLFDVALVLAVIVVPVGVAACIESCIPLWNCVIVILIVVLFLLCLMPESVHPVLADTAVILGNVEGSSAINHRGNAVQRRTHACDESPT